MGDWGASSSPVEQPAQGPVGEGSRHPEEEEREGGCGLGEVRNGGGGVLTGSCVLLPLPAAWTEWREFDSPAGGWVTGTPVAVAPRAATRQVG